VEVTRRALDKAQATQASLNAFFFLMPEKALAAAKAAEAAVMRGDPLGALHGVPLSIKDLIAVGGERFAFGSRCMADNIAVADAPPVERVKAAGAIVIGKTTTSEFGCKGVGDSPLTGITRNPWNLAKTPGGSSAGAAASVAAGITPFALGTDGGGSVRIPGCLTGLAAIKGQFGRIPVWPVSATTTLAHVGPMARTVEDAALLFMACAGYDPRDPYSVAGPVPDLLAACRQDINGLRAAYSPTLGYARPDAEVLRVVDAAAKQFESLGCTVDLVDKVFERYALRDTLRPFFERYDILLSPVLPVTSLDVGKNVPDHLGDRNLVSWVYYTYPFNLTGQPAATVCAGIAADGMPVGIQIVGRAMADADVARAAAVYERSQPKGYNVRGFPT
jgi:aspartyl-tRNA(Asn)/glutamyl-tRNA(Gln) amidotransferase subunit A